MSIFATHLSTCLYNVLIPNFRDRFRTTVNVLGDCFGVGIVQRYSRKQLGPPPPPITTSQTHSTYTPSPKEEERAGASSPVYGSSGGVVYTSPVDSLTNDGPSLLHDSEDTLVLPSGAPSRMAQQDSHKLEGGPDSVPTSDRDETKL